MKKKIVYSVGLAITLGSIWALPQQPTTNQSTTLVNARYVQGVGPGYRPSAGSGLSLNLAGGTAFCGGAMQNYAGGVVTLAASATNYVYLDPASNCAPTANTSGFAPSVIPIAIVPTSASAINSVTDERTQFVGPASPGVTGGICPSNQFITAVGSSAPSCAQPSFANLSGTAAVAQLPLASATSQGILQLGGDLSGSAVTPAVAGLRGNPVSSSAPSANQFLGWNGSQWTPLQPSFSNLSGTATAGQIPAATASAQGAVQLAGDLGGSSSTPRVAALQGSPLSSTAPSGNQVLTWNGTAWAPATPATGAGLGACPGNQYVTATTSGAPTCAQPAFASLAGAASPAQLPAASVSAQGALQLAGDFGGTAAAPQVLSTHLASPLTTSQGGSGAGTFAAHGVLLGEGTSAFSVAGPGTSGQCLLSNGSSADPSFAACPISAATPAGSNTQFEFNNAGSFGGTSNLTYASSTGAVTLNQLANGNETLYGTRSTDTSPTGNLIHFQNYATTADLFKVDTSGNVTAASFTSTASGPFVMSGTEGACSGAAAGKDVLCLGDTNTHTAQLALNGGSFVPIPQLAGDLGGTAAAPKVASIQGTPVTSTAPAANQVLTYNGSAWAPTTPAAGAGLGSCPANQYVTATTSGTPTCAQPAFTGLAGSASSAQLPAATPSAQGAIQLSQDLAGTAAAPTVAGLRGNPVSATVPTTNQVLSWNGSQWTPAQPSFSNLSGAATPGQLPAATSSAQGAVQLSQDLAGSAAAPTVGGLQGNPISATAPTANQVLTYNGSAWAPATPANGAGVGSCPANQYVTATTSSTPTCAQPAFASLAGTASPAQLPAASVSAQGALQLAGDFGGTAAAPQVLSTHLASPLTTAQGGSGAGTFAAHGVLLGEATSAFSVAGPGTSGQCLLSSGSSADPSFAACPVSAATPAGSNTQFEFNNAGSFGGTSNLTYASSTGAVTLNQLANGNETLYGTRTTDTSPTGNLIHFQNYAKTADLFKVDTSGNVTAASFTSTASGPFVMSGTEGACSGSAAGKDVLCLGDTSTHTARLALNGGAFVPIPQLAGDLGGTAAAPQVVSTHLGHLNQTAANGDLAGTIALSAATSASHTFATAFNSAPVCVLTPTSDPGSGARYWVTATAAQVTATVSSAMTITFNYHCTGNPS